VADLRADGTGPVSRLARLAFRATALVYLGFLVVVPLVAICWHTFGHGVSPAWHALTQPDMVHAFQLTSIVAAVAVAIDAVLGTGLALLLVRYRFPGRRVLDALVDLPLSVSPVVVGLALILVYGSDGWFGGIARSGFTIIYAVPGMVLATVFVSLPLVVRELTPVLEHIGEEQEQAASTLGASAWQRFWRITLPSIRWALAYGVMLSLARSLGEFGAVKVVSGNLVGQTQTSTLVVEQAYLGFDYQTAYAASFVLAAVAVACLLSVTVLRPGAEER
jgi:sulfate transport system permease protein